MHVKCDVIIYWSAEEDALLAEAPEPSGCMAAGETHKEALRRREFVMAEWIETARELGCPIPQPRGRLMFA